MRWFQRFFRRGLTEKQLEAELRFHLDQQIGDYVAAGMTPEEARRRARLEFGGLDQVKEECRDVGATRFIETLIQDVRYGGRMLRKNPGFTAVAVLTLALGIGVNTAIFSFADALLFRPLPVKDPARVLTLFRRSIQDPQNYSSFSHPAFIDLRRSVREIFSDLLAYCSIPVNLSTAGNNERLDGGIVSGNYFTLLGVRPALGRGFLPEEDETAGARPVAVISYGLWQRRFGRDPNILARTIALDGHSFAIVGVAPRGFRGADLEAAPDVWVPLMMHAEVSPWGIPGLDLFDNPGTDWLALMGRLKPGVDLRQAEAALQTVGRRFEQADPENAKGWTITAFPSGQAKLDPDMRQDLFPLLALLLGSAGFVLLIACANVANLLLARATARQREFAVRSALGAGRRRLFQQSLTESALLAGFGGVAGVVLAYGMPALVKVLPLPPFVSPQALEFTLDCRSLACALLLSLATALLFGLTPALRATRVELAAGVRDERSARGYRRSRLRAFLVVAQMALSLLLLIATGLFVQSVRRALVTNPGFETRNLLLASVGLGLQGYDKQRGQEFYSQLLERVGALPEVRSATWLSKIPLDAYYNFATDIQVEGAAGQPASTVNVQFNLVAPGCFHTLGIPQLRGRDFSAQGQPPSPHVAIVSETMARRLWPNQDPLGQRFLLKWGFEEGRSSESVEIVGVVADSKYRTWTESPRLLLYLPLSQNYLPQMTLLVRTAGNPASLLGPIQNEVKALDSRLPLYNVKTMRQQIDISVWPQELGSGVLGAFGLLALLLAAVGIYGMMSFVVVQRTHEIGIRMALGAARRDVMKSVLAQALRLVLAGMALGLVGALALTRFIASLLFGVKPTDPVTFAGVCLILTGVAVLASYLPARRAARVDPMVALRYE
jgi:putative ABC transport system permease protein